MLTFGEALLSHLRREDGENKDLQNVGNAAYMDKVHQSEIRFTVELNHRDNFSKIHFNIIIHVLLHFENYLTPKVVSHACCIFHPM
jgi:hypothetical protein